MSETSSYLDRKPAGEQRVWNMLRNLLGRFDRVGLTGYSRTGKSTIYAAGVNDREVLHSDAWKDIPPTEQAVAMAAWFAERKPGRYLFEGTLVPRFVRKTRALHPGELEWQVQALVFLAERAGSNLKPGARAQGQGIKTVLDDVRRKHPDVVIVEVRG